MHEEEAAPSQMIQPHKSTINNTFLFLIEAFLLLLAPLSYIAAYTNINPYAITRPYQARSPVQICTYTPMQIPENSLLYAAAYSKKKKHGICRNLQCLADTKCGTRLNRLYTAAGALNLSVLLLNMLHHRGIKYITVSDHPSV